MQCNAHCLAQHVEQIPGTSRRPLRLAESALLYIHYCMSESPMNITKALVVGAAVAALAGCETVRQQDLAAWEGVSVQALDTHPVFVSMPMYKTMAENGMEIRNYVNSESTEQCFASGGTHRGSSKHVRYDEFISCSENKIVCNNIFYVQDGKVVRYAPTGSCYTDDSVRPQSPIGK